MWPCIVTNFLRMKPTRSTNFSNLFWNETTCFGLFLCPSSGVIHCTHSNSISHTDLADCLRAGSGWNCRSILILLASSLQTCMKYAIAVYTVNNSWWWTEELSETCRVSFQNKFEKLVLLVGFILRKRWQKNARNKIQDDSVARGPKLLSMYTVEQRGFLVRKYWQTGLFKACQTTFRTEFVKGVHHRSVASRNWLKS